MSCFLDILLRKQIPKPRKLSRLDKDTSTDVLHCMQEQKHLGKKKITHNESPKEQKLFSNFPQKIKSMCSHADTEAHRPSSLFLILFASFN